MAMAFLFICPNHNKSFETADFSIVENRGITIDEAGNKVLDAKVSIDNPCPYCNEIHIYHASELSCPFEGPKCH